MNSGTKTPAVAVKFGVTIVVTEKSRFPNGQGGLLKHLLGMTEQDAERALRAVLERSMDGAKIDVTRAVETGRQRK